MADGVESVNDRVADLFVDSNDVPSKNAIKKELKKKQKEEEKRLKEEEKKKAAAMPTSQSQKPSSADDEDMDPTQYFDNRLRVLASLKAAGENLYPYKFEVSISVVDYVKQYGGLSDGDHLKDVEVNLAGRIMIKRTSSSKLCFYDLYGGGAKVQVMADARDSDMDEVEFSRHQSGVKWGDIVGICGYPGVSMASLTELSFNWLGYISAMISNISFTYRSIYSISRFKDVSYVLLQRLKDLS